MGKRWILIIVAMLTLLFSACKAEQETVFPEVLPAGQELFRYEGTEGADAIAVDEEGFLYTVSYRPKEDMGQASIIENRTATQHFSVYDLEGRLILEKDVWIGNGTMATMIAENGKLYCVASNDGPILYVVDTTTWEVEELCELKGYSSYITQIVHIGEYFYLCGRLENRPAKSYTLHPDVYSYTYQGETVSRINPAAEQPKVEQFQVDFPISIFKTAKDTLMVYQYTEEYGFGFLEFSPEKQTLTGAGQKQGATANGHYIMCEDGYLFWENGSLYYGTTSGADAELTSETVMVWNDLVYQKGFAFYGNYYADKMVERICVADLLKENKTIHLLMHTDMQDMPFGCGYRMERMELGTEQYALKVLAQDSDFDVFVLSTRNNSSYNLKENGAFYALNEVDGVQEYIDACFPYIKELATNKDGDIWMLPIKLAIPSIFYNRDYCNKMGVDLSAMDFMEFLRFTKQERNEGKNGEETISISFYVIREELFGQYLQNWDSFDTQILKDYLGQIKEITDNGTWLFNYTLCSAVKNRKQMDFYYFYEVHQANYQELIQAVGTSEHIGVLGVPKMAEGIGNVGTLTFLAVNPQAENLEAALNYVSSFAKYMLGQKDTFLFADETAYTDTPLVHDLYCIYADGAVRFAMDTSIFDEQYMAYLNDKLTLEEMIAESERRRKIYMGE